MGLLFELSQLRVGGVVDSQLVLNRVNHLQGSRQLVLGQQTNLQVEIRAPLGLFAQPVLADEDEGGQEDGLQRHDHGQKAVGEGIEGPQTQVSGVDQDPEREPDDVKVD